MKMNYRTILLSVFLILSSYNSFCQYFTEEKEASPLDKIFFGGNFGFAFGTVTHVDISPIVGYRITPEFSAGIGGTYQYYREDFEINGNSVYTWKTKIYGGKLFASYNLVPELGKYLPIEGCSLIAHTEYEMLNLDTYRQTVNGLYFDNGRKWITNILVGGGLSQSIGGKGSIDVLVLWNLNQTVDSPYSNPILRVGFNF